MHYLFNLTFFFSSKVSTASKLQLSNHIQFLKTNCWEFFVAYAQMHAENQIKHHKLVNVSQINRDDHICMSRCMRKPQSSLCVSSWWKKKRRPRDFGNGWHRKWIVLGTNPSPSKRNNPRLLQFVLEKVIIHKSCVIQ